MFSISYFGIPRSNSYDNKLRLKLETTAKIKTRTVRNSIISILCIQYSQKSVFLSENTTKFYFYETFRPPKVYICFYTPKVNLVLGDQNNPISRSGLQKLLIDN